MIANTPANWVVSQARAELAAADATLGNVHGSAWNGSAELALQGRHLGRLQWHTSLWPLLAGNLNARFKIKGDKLELSGGIASNDDATRLSDIQGQAGMDLLAELLGLPAGLKGTLVADLSKVVINSHQAVQSAEGSLVAHGVRIPDLGVGLGTLTLKLHDQGKGVRGTLDNSGGDIALDGTLMLTQTGAYVLQATLKPRTGPKQNQIRDGLTVILGAVDSAGRFHYSATGQLGLH